MMKHFLLYGHGGSYNHGAEAIAKTTIELIRQKYDEVFITLSTHYPGQDKEFRIDADEIIGPDTSLWEREKAADCKDKEYLARMMYKDALGRITPDTTLLSIGGDNFCYPNWHRLKVFQDEASRNKAKSVLWSASVDTALITSDMIKVLNSYSAITVREHLTREVLLENGVISKTAIIPDIAFRLSPESTGFSEELIHSDLIGINISPLIIRKEIIPGIVTENLKKLICYILTQTNYNIVLIPHVVVPVDNDYSILSEVYSLMSGNGRIHLVSDKLSAAQYKYVISQCKFILCSRTHVSIAAYSSCIPCVVIGYSIKSLGIAKDLGMDNFIVNVTRIDSNDYFINLFQNIIEDGDHIRKILSKRMNNYISQTENYSRYI